MEDLEIKCGKNSDHFEKLKALCNAEAEKLLSSIEVTKAIRFLLNKYHITRERVFPQRSSDYIYYTPGYKKPPHLSGGFASYTFPGELFDNSLRRSAFLYLESTGFQFCGKLMILQRLLKLAGRRYKSLLRLEIESHGIALIRV